MFNVIRVILCNYLHSPSLYQTTMHCKHTYVWISRLRLRTEIRQRRGEKLRTSSFCNYLTLGYCSWNNVSGVLAFIASEAPTDVCVEWRIQRRTGWVGEIPQAFGSPLFELSFFCIWFSEFCNKLWAKKSQNSKNLQAHQNCEPGCSSTHAAQHTIVYGPPPRLAE